MALKSNRCVNVHAARDVKPDTATSASAVNGDASRASIPGEGFVILRDKWACYNGMLPSFILPSALRIHLLEHRKKSTLSRLLKVAQQRFQEAKSKLVMRFTGDGKSDITLVVWDFGGQKVSTELGQVEDIGGTSITTRHFIIDMHVSVRFD